MKEMKRIANYVCENFEKVFDYTFEDFCDKLIDEVIDNENVEDDVIIENYANDIIEKFNIDPADKEIVIDWLNNIVG